MSSLLADASPSGNKKVDINRGWRLEVQNLWTRRNNYGSKQEVIHLQTIKKPFELMNLVDGLFISKIRCGLQLIGKVRLHETYPTNKDIIVLFNKYFISYGTIAYMSQKRVIEKTSVGRWSSLSFSDWNRTTSVPMSVPRG